MGSVGLRPGKNHIRLVPVIRKKDSDGFIDMFVGSPLLRQLKFLGSMIQVATLMPDTPLQNKIFEINATANKEIGATVDIAVDLNRYVLKMRKETALGGAAADLLGVNLSEALVERAIASEVIETPEGVEQEYEISRSFERSVVFTQSLGAELSGNFDFGTFSAEIKARIENQESHAIKQSETIRRNVKIDGSKTPRLRVDWIGIFRVGTADIYFKDERKRIPFSIQVGLRPKLSVLRD